jgi:hypothetical protein
MKNLFLASLVFFISFQSFSQTTDAKNTSSNFNIGYQGNINTTGIWIPGTYKQNFIDGSVYLFPNFTGQYTVISKNGESRQLFNLNFNLKTKTLESLISKDSVFQYNLEQFDYVISSNNKYKVNAEGDFSGLSLEIYNSPKIQFFKDVSIIIEKGVVNPMTQTMISEDKYVQSFSYYFYTNGKAVKVKLNKSDILKQLADKKDVIKKFASENDFSFSNESDVAKILKHYDAL